jgi:hypothetical protein
VRISHRYRFVFFANPKTGSSTVRQLLDPYADIRSARNFRERTAENPFYPHMRPEEARALFRRFGWDFDGYTKFVFVRNPWARLVSLYEHIHRWRRPAAPPFSKWVRSVRPYGEGGGGEEWERWRRYGAYSIEYFIKDASGGVLVDKVIRLEDIDHALLPFLTTLKLPLAATNVVPWRNRRRIIRPYAEYYTPEAVEHVRDLYRYDIVNYGYAFGD